MARDTKTMVNRCTALSSTKVWQAKQAGWWDETDPDVRDRCRCARYAIRGGSVCPHHGGSASHVKAAAEANLVKAEARHFLETNGKEIKPVASLAELGQAIGQAIGESLAFRDRMAAAVAALEDAGEKLDYRDKWAVERTRALLDTYRAAAKDAQDFLIRATKVAALINQQTGTDDRPVPMTQAMNLIVAMEVGIRSAIHDEDLAAAAVRAGRREIAVRNILVEDDRNLPALPRRQP